MAALQVQRRFWLSAVRRVLEDVLCAGVARRVEDSSCPSDDFVGFGQLSSVSFGNIGQTKWVLARSDNGRTSVRGSARVEVSRDGECGARRRRNNGGVVAGGASLQQSFVHRVSQNVVRISPAVSSVVV
eukprot:1099375-Pleurochrysis_carterae.AAC.1